MKKATIILAITLMLSEISFAQNMNRDFGQILQTYYLHKDNDVVDKAVDFINKTPMDYNKLSPILTGFFGAAFINDKTIKSDFAKKLNLVEKPEFKQLLTFLLSSNIDTIYSKTKISTSLNDMNWSSFFATGSTKYLDNIIANAPYIENRTDLNLFLAGATAKWSLSSNSRQHALVTKYLNSLINKNIMLKEILEKEPQYFQNATIGILKIQREKGIWN
ncbi:hypothetical protein EZ449_20630 [Pedobacter frigidisoli]|uniref:Uncharacterized protein n=1 Tax=Pedobacter frigidisoli TaxID=2530455 RepID=A0A4V2ML41_9SPHI|nr:hypothetical protein [Pedobacter frigidisoli]TCD00567.1 hypothetical protein EZ449_20630 [Pedobacter frigidisoli]